MPSPTLNTPAEILSPELFKSKPIPLIVAVPPDCVNVPPGSLLSESRLNVPPFISIFPFIVLVLPNATLPLLSTVKVEFWLRFTLASSVIVPFETVKLD